MVHLFCYPKADKTKSFNKSFTSEYKADAWILKHNEELLCFVPDYWSNIVALAEHHSGEPLESEQMSLF